jgi:hypothetical protein
MKALIYRFFLLLFSVLALSCEKEFIPDIPLEEPQLVVEGYIEAGDRALPPYVFLTRSIPFFQELDSAQFDNLFVSGAEIYVRESDREIQLTEVCFADLTPEQRELAQAFLGINPDEAGLNFCVYLDPTFQFLGEVGKTYELEVRAEGKVLRAQTTIANPVPLDSLRFQQPPGEPSDSLRELEVLIRDPAQEVNFYRYFTQTNSEPLRAPFASVFDDALFNGKEFSFPLPRAEAPDADFDPETFGLYRLGDTLLVKWCTLDEAHFDFWNTLEFNQANQGPFSSYTLVEDNVEGGLGVWGGYAARYYNLIVEDSE